LTRRSDKERESEEALARVAAAQASSDALDRMRAEHLLSRPMVDRLQKRFEDWIEARSLHLFRMVAEEPSLAEANMDLMLREIGDAQKEALLRLMRRGSISEEVFSESMRQVDELMSDPSYMAWFLSAELEEGLGTLSPEEPAAADP
jgi:hypothetical protein